MDPLRLVPCDALGADRRDMTDGSAVVDRMARDVLAARRAGQYGLVDLTEYGWTVAQVMRWGSEARDLAASTAFATHDVVERMRDRDDRCATAVTLALADGVVPPITGDMTTMVDDLTSGDAA